MGTYTIVSATANSPDNDAETKTFLSRGVELRVCVVMVVVALRVPLVPPNIVLPPFARLFFSFFSSCLVFALVFEC
jgi:hypothetical protein